MLVWAKVGGVLLNIGMAIIVDAGAITAETSRVKGE
jgi:hypothetical protein